MNKPANHQKNKTDNRYQAKIRTPFAVLGICIEEDWLTEIDYLPLNTSLMTPGTPLAKEVCAQLQAYLSDPRYTFDLSLHISGTVHQRRVWEQIQDIPSGQTCSYADIAAKIHSAPRAVGRACGANKIPIVIPCHRIIAKNGGLGGFMNARDGEPLEIKRWLLQHESI
ncbi:MAG TPA: cysteine methyltransferase [Nitrosomonas nitrosa]|uniref:methylated-DNA--[protein]-cysteine S-methyltransferase n=1 Tax=Nitrosomonas sp. TaxID=42353 RepID=UPI000ECE021A|nr:methylated-DNA--[protein]-cysteine S-methyltransferase [Nitrosomonas sp.]GJL74970.1 MAG: methylated-DNA--protein-cysteine methyltransferase [Nitrosomonas sp.]HBZ29933.1 cysteine methyltransferase [Nitrosomonas nitrosa]